MVQSPDYLTLLAQADKLFKSTWPEAVTFTALGSAAAGLATKANDLTNWSFIAQTNKGAAELIYANGSFGSPVIKGTWIGLMFDPLPQGKLSLEEAIEAINSQGFTQGFSDVSMGTPVYKDPEPMYWFCIDRMIQGISASTGDYYPNLFPCSGTHPGQLSTE